MKNTDLIIFSGQSNMEGEAERFPLDNSPVEGALEYRYLEHKLVPLRHPAGENISNDGKFFLPRHRDGWGTTQNCALLSAWRKRTNPAPFFCESYVKESGRSVICVHAAKGATTIDEWQKGMTSYEMLVKKSKRAIEMTNPEHVYFVWLQGESDALAKKSKDKYKEQMISLYKSLHEELGVELFGNILVGRFSMDEYDFEIINAQKEVCREQDGFVMLTEITEKIFSDPAYMNPEAFGHYGYEGQKLIGYLAGKALADFIKQKM